MKIVKRKFKITVIRKVRVTGVKVTTLLNKTSHKSVQIAVYLVKYFKYKKSKRLLYQSTPPFLVSRFILFYVAATPFGKPERGAAVWSSLRVLCSVSPFQGVLSNISSITDLGGLDPVWLFMVVGGVMFILGFAGCIGALRENTFLLKFFSVFLGIIFFLELTTGVLAFVFKDWIKDQLNLFINNNIRAYRDDIDLQNLIDFTQEYWECCGAFGADDWNLNIYFNCTDGNPSREKCGVPFSCCTKDPAEDVINTQCGYDIRAKPDSEQKDYINVKGCVPQFEKWLQDNLTLVAGIFIGVALLQIFGICLAQNLVSDIEAVRASCFFT
uniref:Uncharacterized protein n=1 Tax=Mastacembelus armatus TaxID=205130 RepID=A0A3Q3KQM3_9TELE